MHDGIDLLRIVFETPEFSVKRLLGTEPRTIKVHLKVKEGHDRRFNCIDLSF